MTFAASRSLGLAVAAAFLLHFGTAPVQAEELKVTIDNFTFSPAELIEKAADTVTWTGVMLGYCATGSCDIETRPARQMISATTAAKTGRSMKNRENMALTGLRKDRRGAPGRRCRRPSR